MGLTLREAMSLAEPLRRARVLAGSGGLDRTVHAVNVMEVPEILDWVRPGELLVTTMYPLRDQAAAIETLIPRLAEKGLVGLAVTPGGYIDTLPACMLEAADALDFPLIELPPKVSFIDIIQPLTSRILDLQADELRESERIHRQFIELVLSGGRHAEIAQGVAQRLQRPVLIVDRFRRVLGSSLLMGQPHPEKAFLIEDGSGELYLSEAYAPELIELLPGSEARRLKLRGAEGTLEVISLPIKVGPTSLGEILVWGPLAEPPNPMDLIALEHASTVIALKMMEMRSISEVEERFRNEILEGLLSQRAGMQSRAVQLAGELGNRLVTPFLVMLVGPDLPAGASLSQAERAEQRGIDSSLDLARRYLRSLEPGASFWYQGPRLVVFFPLADGRYCGPSTELVADLQKICDRIGRENEPYTISIGLSAIAEHLQDFRRAYESARQSLEIGPGLGARQSGAVVRYEDLGLFRVIWLVEARASLEGFCTTTLGPLLAYDAEHGTELVRTLRVYLEHSQNSARTAKRLFIHYNTLRYRLDRIREILGDALAHPQQRLAIEVALQIHALLRRPARR